MIPLLLALAIAPVDDLKVDAFFQEWVGAPTLPMRTVRGACGGADLTALTQVSYDATHLYFAIQVVDDRALGGGETTGDGLSLRFVLPSGRARRLQVVLNDYEPPHGALLRLDGKPYRRGAVRATTRVDGWAVELSMPLTDLPGWIGGPRRFAAVVTDADVDPTEVEGVCASAALDAKGLPKEATVNFGGPAPFFRAFRAERPGGEVLRERAVDLNHDAVSELVVVTEADLFIGGYGLPGGAGFVYFSHGWGLDPTLTRFELHELDGTPGEEILLEHREWAVPGETEITVAEIYTLRPDGLRRLFAQQTGERAPAWESTASAPLRVRRGKRGAVLQVGPAKVVGFNPGTVVPIGGPNPPFTRLPWPWDHPRGQRWVLTPTGVAPESP